MTPEEKRQFEEWQLRTENRMNFLVEQQAIFETNQLQLQEGLRQTQALLNQLALAQVRQQERLEQLEEQADRDRQERDAQADRDRRIMREVVQDLKDVIALAHEKSDRANRRLDSLENKNG